MKYHNALRKIRLAKGLTQKELAELTNLDQSYISLIEKDKRKPSVEILEIITGSLKVPLYLFFLMASEKKDLKGLSESEANSLSSKLLGLLQEFPNK